MTMRQIKAWVRIRGTHHRYCASVRNEYGKETMFYLDTLAAKQFIMQRALMRQA